MVAKAAAMVMTACDNREGRNGSNGNSDGGDVTIAAKAAMPWLAAPWKAGWHHQRWCHHR